MTIAQLLLVQLAATMIVDLLLTLEGLRHHGVKESNSFALMLMDRLGSSRGLIVHQAGWFALIATGVIVFPSQWFAPLLACLSYGAAVIGNVRLLHLIPTAKGS